MTRDRILVEREYDGERCGDGCDWLRIVPGEFAGCELFGKLVYDTRERCRACLSTPGVEVKS